MNAAELLAHVEDLPDTESGAFIVEDGGSPLGAVLVERRRVCWAGELEHGRRLRDLLLRYSSSTISTADLEEVVASCQTNGTSLAATLVDRGICSEEAMRAALRQHTIESLIALCSKRASHVSWVPHRRGGYRAAYAMAPVMLLAAIGAQTQECDDLELAEHGLAEVSPGASFVVSRDERVLVHVAGADALDVRTVYALGAWAAAAFEACAGFSAPVLARRIEETTGAVALGWRSSRRVVHAAVIEERGALLQARAELERRRYPAVLTSHHNTTISGRRDNLGAINVNG